MLQCFTNLIGIKNGCGLTAPTSQFFVNDLKGMSLKVAESGVNEETSDGVQLINDKISFASETIIQEIRTFLKPKMRSNSVIENDTAGKYDDNLEAVALEAAKYKGILVEIKNTDYLSFFLSSVRLKLNAAVNTNILVIDLMDGKIVLTQPITTVADEATEIFINRSFPVKQQTLQLLICIDSSVAGTFDTKLTDGCVSCDGTYRNRMVRFSAKEILQASQLIKDNLISINHTNGISINYSVRCDIEPFVCNMADSLAYPLLHKTGSEIMGELRVSNRLNSIVLIYGDNIETLETEFETKYADSMNQLLDNLAMPTNICFECKKQVKHVVSLP